MSSSDKEAIRAVVKKIIPDGTHGPYAVATTDGIEGSITFSLKEDVWNENDWPEPGTIVLLSKLCKKTAGWRSMEARLYKIEDEQLANSKEDIMNKINALFLRWKSKYFPTETDKVWVDWVYLGERRGLIDLDDLIQNGKIKDEYKARALFILLTPHLSWCPFFWIDHDGAFKNYYSYISRKSFKINSLSVDLLLYVSELITVFYQHLKDRKVLNSHSRSAMSNYNSYIIELAAILPEEYVGKILLLFEFNDPRRGDRDPSRYHPLEQIFRHLGIGERWKKEADNMMHRIIRNGPGGTTLNEFALKCYTSIVESMLHFDHLPYSRKLFLDQIRFIAEVTSVDCYRDPFSSSDITKILKMIAVEGENDYLSAQFSILVLTRDDEFKVNKGSLEAAELMLEAIKDSCPKEANSLKLAIISAKQHLIVLKKQAQEKEQAEKSLLEKMKHSVN